MIRSIVIGSILLTFSAAQNSLTITNYPTSISDVAFQMTVSYTLSAELANTKTYGIHALLLDSSGNYMSNGEWQVTPGVQAGSHLITITPPIDFYSRTPVGSGLRLKAMIMEFSYLMYNSTIAWRYSVSESPIVTATSAARTVSTTKGKMRFVGVNLSGAEYDEATYPEPNGSGAHFRELGFNIFNLPTRWHKLQPDLAVASLSSAELTKLKSAVNHITNTLGAFCAIQPHDYGRWNKVYMFGEGPLATPTLFANFWAMLAAEFKGNPRVIFSLINEPNNQPSQPVIDAYNAAIAAIRDEGVDNMIMVQTPRWGSGGNFYLVDNYGLSNAVIMNQVTDPANNLIINIHQYFDSSRGGTYPGCLTDRIGVQKLSAVTLWLRANGKKGYVGELGASNTETCKDNIADLLSFLEANSDVWAGWAYWEAGYHNRENFMSIEPMYGSDRPQTAWLLPHLQYKCAENGSDALSDDPMYSTCKLYPGAEMKETETVTESPTAEQERTPVSTYGVDPTEETTSSPTVSPTQVYQPRDAASTSPSSAPTAAPTSNAARDVMTLAGKFILGVAILSMYVLCQ